MNNQVNLNFGAIRDSVVRLSNYELTNNQKSKSVEQFTKKLKESAILKKQYIVYKNFEKCKPFDKDRLAERFINQNMSIFKSGEWETLMNENRDIRIGLLENKHIESYSRNDDLFNNIHTLIEARTREGFYEFEREQAAYESLVEFLTRREDDVEVLSEEKNDESDILSWELFTKIALNKFNERYSHLNESERELFKALTSTLDKKVNYLDDVISECNSIIDREIQSGSKDSVLLEAKEKISKVKKDDIDNSIIYCYELFDALRSI